MTKANTRSSEAGSAIEVTDMKTIDVIIAVLLVIGGANWGLVGLFNFDLVAAIFGDGALLSRIVYTVVGAAAAYQALGWKAIQGRWQNEDMLVPARAESR
jgi:uncharacterized membrane protein YuzA (DUF378 family)